MLKNQSIHLSKLTLGTCYYPEHWDSSMWVSDLRRMKEHGISVIRIFEFAWSLVEPEEGIFDFTFFDSFMRIAREENMKVIFCTPTATPPAWLTTKYPQVLNSRMDGTVLHHGHRRHYNYNAPEYLELTERVVEQLARHYASDPLIVCWQIDNEVNCETDVFYSDADRAAFRTYLKERFGTLDALNAAIGATFWNQAYTSWDQVDMERPTISDHANPHMALLEKQFFSVSANRYVKLQCDTIRRFNMNARITTNGIFGHLDNVEMTQNALDFITYDSYPNFANSCSETGESRGDMRLKDRIWSKMLAGARELSPNFGVMEQQSGANGWDFRMLAPMPRPGQMRLWAYQSIANGADYVSFFRWRTCTYGTEIYWHGINDYCNRDNRRLREVKELSEELKSIPEVAGSHYLAKVAVATDYLNEWDGERDEWHGPLDRASQMAIFEAGQLSHTPMDVFHFRNDTELADIKQYDAIFYPHPTILTEERAKLLRSYVEDGGKLYIGARTGYKDEYGRCLMIPMPGYAAELCGVEVEDYTMAHPHEPAVKIEAFDECFDAPIFHDILKVTDGKVLGTFKGSYYSGAPALVRKEYSGGGSATYLGSGFSMEMAAKLLKEDGVAMPFENAISCDEEIELAVRCKDEKAYYFLLNYTDEPRHYQCKEVLRNAVSGETVTGEMMLGAYDVHVLVK